MSKSKTLLQPEFPLTAFQFMRLLKKNNNREWFNARKKEYLLEKAGVEIFADALITELNKHDVIETLSGKQCLHWIYRDVRFSKDKSPYRPEWSGSFKRATKYRRGGYYFHIEEGNTFVGGGFRAPNAPDLKLIRDDIAFDDAPLRKILKSKSFLENFGTLQGEQLKTTPRGYEAASPGIDLLRYKQFLLIRKFSDKEVSGKDFFLQVSDIFRAMRPFFDYMSEVLAADANGAIA